MSSSQIVGVAAGVQIAITVGFVLQAVFAYRYGEAAQRAAEAEVERQGVPPGVLKEHGVKFDESAVEMLLPLGIAGVLGGLAALNLAGIQTGRTLTLILQPILLLVGGWVTANQVFATRQLTSAFRKSGDATLQRIDVGKFVAAAMRTFPGGFRSLVVTRFVLTTAGSALIIILLALPAADDHFS